MKLKIKTSAFVKVSDIEIPDIFFHRLKTGIKEFDSLFGEGILPGSSMTFCGCAGVGKTTLLLQLMESLASNGYEVGYASGEENRFQLAYTCKRLNITNVAVANETDIDKLVAATRDLDVLVIDSFQALSTTDRMNVRELERYAVNSLVSAGKENECVIIFVMHLTKSGQLKGSTLVPHSVDVNFRIDMDPESDETARIIDVYKNRFGTSGQYSATMTRTGIELSDRREVTRTSSKKDRNKKLENKVLEMDPPNITKKYIISQLNITASQAYVLLKKMTDEGKLQKFGRGDSAVWKKTQKVSV
jgi:predicted ATP-dependent serine protease